MTISVRVKDVVRTCGGVNFSSSKSLENCLPLVQCPLVIAPYDRCKPIQ